MESKRKHSHDRIIHKLGDAEVALAQLVDDLFCLVSFECHRGPLERWIFSLELDPLLGLGYPVNPVVFCPRAPRRHGRTRPASLSIEIQNEQNLDDRSNHFRVDPAKAGLK